MVTNHSDKKLLRSQYLALCK